MIGKSQAIEKVREMIEKVAPTDARVMITELMGREKKLWHDCFMKTATAHNTRLWK